ncbi:hypothetical protein [Aureimonas sp. Leaf324]|jgi:hypothetical protein|uniref:hypothetical protein n=1 Tax=Aureimonas sp. Leaf324 TaxID=1736336 RepID=UPI000B0DDA04|nr:hypothetical protein [Aureimonas sp. Leaf324]
MSGDEKTETTQEKTQRLKAARLQAERDRDARIERDTRKAAARRKVLAGPAPGKGSPR